MPGLLGLEALRDLGLTILSLGGGTLVLLALLREGWHPAHRGLDKTEKVVELIAKIEPALAVINAQMTMNGGKSTLVDRVAMIPGLAADVASLRTAMAAMPCANGGCPAIRRPRTPAKVVEGG